MNDQTARPEDGDIKPQNGSHPNRRTVVQGIGVSIVAGAVGYVGFTAYGPEPGRSGAKAKYAAGAPSGAASTPGATATVLAALSDIPDGGGLVLQDAELVLTRSGDTVKCFSAVCTHQGCLVSGVVDGVISCPCHGSAFDVTTGAVTRGPASSPLPEIAVVVSGDSVVKA